MARKYSQNHISGEEKTFFFSALADQHSRPSWWHRRFGRKVSGRSQKCPSVLNVPWKGISRPCSSGCHGEWSWHTKGPITWVVTRWPKKSLWSCYTRCTPGTPVNFRGWLFQEFQSHFSKSQKLWVDKKEALATKQKLPRLPREIQRQQLSEDRCCCLTQLQSFLRQMMEACDLS